MYAKTKEYLNILVIINKKELMSCQVMSRKWKTSRGREECVVKQKSPKISIRCKFIETASILIYKKNSYVNNTAVLQWKNCAIEVQSSKKSHLSLHITKRTN